MLKAMKSSAPMRAMAAAALALAVSAPSADQHLDETYWYASGDPSVPDGQLWVNSYGECWQSAAPDGPTNLPPCHVVIPEEATGSDEYNMVLGQNRADAVRSYIIRRGYPEQNVAPAESMGKRDMLPEYDPFSVMQRRVVLTKTDG